MNRNIVVQLNFFALIFASIGLLATNVVRFRGPLKSGKPFSLQRSKISTIVNGVDSVNRAFYVRLYDHGKFVCGGTIAHRFFVLTADSCIGGETR